MSSFKPKRAPCFVPRLLLGLVSNRIIGLRLLTRDAGWALFLPPKLLSLATLGHSFYEGDFFGEVYLGILCCCDILKPGLSILPSSLDVQQADTTKQRSL